MHSRVRTNPRRVRWPSRSLVRCLIHYGLVSRPSLWVCEGRSRFLVAVQYVVSRQPKLYSSAESNSQTIQNDEQRSPCYRLHHIRLLPNFGSLPLLCHIEFLDPSDRPSAMCIWAVERLVIHPWLALLVDLNRPRTHLP